MLEKAQMYILTGLPFAGKSTLGREIAETRKIDAIRLDGIIKRRNIGLRGEHIPEEQYVIFHEEAERRATEKLQKGKSIVYDTTPFTRVKRNHLKQLALMCGADAILIYVKASHELALQRWETENRNPDRLVEGHIDNFMYAMEHFEPPIDEDHIVFEAGDNMYEWISIHIQPLIR